MLSPGSAWINIYEETIEDKQNHLLEPQTASHSKATVEQIQHLNSSTPPQLLNMNSTMLCNLQKQDKFCKSKACELHANIDDRFYLNTDSILKWKVIINNLEVHTILIPFALTHTLLHEFHNCRGYQGCARTTQLTKRKFLVEGHEKRCKVSHT